MKSSNHCILDSHFTQNPSSVGLITVNNNKLYLTWSLCSACFLLLALFPLNTSVNTKQLISANE